MTDLIHKKIVNLSRSRIAELAQQAIAEDIGRGDVTTEAIVPENTKIKAVISTRSNIVVSGNEIAETVFKTIDCDVQYRVKAKDGDRAAAKAAIAEITGKARAILAGERTALNFMQKMSGIATLTSQFVAKAKPYGVTVLDTRKTTPLLRDLEKYAVRCGGGINHRTGLYDRILIKDNHRKLLRRDDQDNICAAVSAARRLHPEMIVEVEVETETEFLSALRAEPDWILLDNMTPSLLRKYTEICSGKCLIEASGGITINNIHAIVRTGINAVSLGCLTHSAPSADLSLEVLQYTA